MSEAPWEGEGRRTFVVAEAGSNWRSGTRKRDLDLGRTLIDLAAEAGADAVKFQTFRAETVYVPNAGTNDNLSRLGIDDDISELFRDLAMPYEYVPVFAEHAAAQGLAFMSSVFSRQDFEVVDPHTPVHKIASYEITHLRLLELVAATGKPTLISTGGSREEDIAWAIDTFRAAGGGPLCVMQCTAQYPAKLEDLNLSVIPWLRERFGVTPGFSDHSEHPVYGPAAAVALGARVVEKHYTVHRRLPGPDHRFAVDGEGLKAMVAAIRAVEQALGSGVKEVLAAEEELRDYAHRSLQAIAPIAAGEPLREDQNVAILRSGRQAKGAHPKHLPELEGRPATRDIPLGDGIREGDWEA